MKILNRHNFTIILTKKFATIIKYWIVFYDDTNHSLHIVHLHICLNVYTYATTRLRKMTNRLEMATQSKQFENKQINYNVCVHLQCVQSECNSIIAREKKNGNGNKNVSSEKFHFQFKLNRSVRNNRHFY